MGDDGAYARDLGGGKASFKGIPQQGRAQALTAPCLVHGKPSDQQQRHLIGAAFAQFRRGKKLAQQWGKQRSTQGLTLVLPKIQFL